MTLAAPTRRQARRELLAMREPFRLAASLRGLLARRAAAPQPVVTVPGFGADDGSMAPLRRYLRRLGHQPEGWGLGRNNGEVETLRDELGARIADRTDRPVLIGWSLGGVIAREVARDLPDVVGGVVTYGTPLIGGPRYTRAAGVYPNERIDEIERLIIEREQVPITVAVTAIYSRNDGIVAWEACIDPYPNNIEHIEVRSSHLGMSLDPDVWRIVAERLDAQVRNEGGTRYV